MQNYRNFRKQENSIQLRYHSAEATRYRHYFLCIFAFEIFKKISSKCFPFKISNFWLNTKYFSYIFDISIQYLINGLKRAIRMMSGWCHCVLVFFSLSLFRFFSTFRILIFENSVSHNIQMNIYMYKICAITVVDTITSHVFMRPKFLIVFLNSSLSFPEFFI